MCFFFSCSIWQQPTRSLQFLSILSIVCSCILPMALRILFFKMSIVVTLIFDGTPQIIVERCQIAVPRWPNDISSAANNAIFKNRTQNIECSFGYVARSAVLLKPNVVNVLLLNFCEQKFVQQGLAPCSFWKKNCAITPRSKFAPNSNSFWACKMPSETPGAILFAKTHAGLCY